MNSLEFINLEIATVKKDYKKHINFGQTNFAIADEKRLKQLQQIKDILEAWEVCMSDNSILYVIQALAEGEPIDWHRLPEEKQIKLKKALEVKDD